MTQTQKNTLKATTAPVEALTSDKPEEGSIREGQNLFDMLKAPAAGDVQKKSAFVSTMRQRLAQVADEAKKNGDEAQETEKLAGVCATELYFARRNTVISGDELTAMLGDTFGYKPKQDGTPGKTPMGAGDAIRKRVVRSLQGWDYINGGDGGRFFDGLPVEDVDDIIRSIGRVKKVQEGDKTFTVPDGPSVWTAYKLLGDVKSQSAVRVEFAFDPKKIAGLVEKLSESGAREKFLTNPSLVKAYGALFDQLRIISHVDASEADAIKSRLGIVEQPETESEPETVNEGGEELAA